MTVIAYDARPYQGIEVYETKFDQSTNLDYWGGALNCSVTGGAFVSSSPWPDDHNHDAGIGRLALAAYRDERGWETTLPSGKIVGSDFTGARVFVDATFLNPSFMGGHWYFWIQARDPDNPARFPNYALTALPLDQYADGTRRKFEFDVPCDPAAWTFAGGAAAKYAAALPIDVALRNICDMHLPLVGVSGLPSGTLKIHRFRIAYLRRLAQPPPPPGVPGMPTLTFQTNTSSTAAGPAVTFLAQAIGTPAADRRVIVGVMSAVTGGVLARSISSITANGINLLEAVQNNNGTLGGVTVGLFMGNVPTDTTADIVITFSGAVARTGIGVWTCVGLDSDVKKASGSHMATDPAVVTLTPIFADGFAIAVGMENNGATFTWTNATKRFDTTVDGAGHSGADNTSPGTSLTITADFSLTDARCGMCAAAWGSTPMTGGNESQMLVMP